MKKKDKEKSGNFSGSSYACGHDLSGIFYNSRRRECEDLSLKTAS